MRIPFICPKKPSTKCPAYAHVAIIDDSVPSDKPFGFRNKEIYMILQNMPNAHAYALASTKIGDLHFMNERIGMSKHRYNHNVKAYLKQYPENTNRISYLSQNPRHIKLAFCYFLLETYAMLPYFEKNNIPFVFLLYPGVVFGLNNTYVDRTLKRIFDSPCFRHVIVSQYCIQNYLLDKKLCPANKMSFLFGSCVQFSRHEIPEVRHYYKQDKDTFDVAFVAMKYSTCGRDKGYDLFVDACKMLLKKYPQVRLHIVGNWGPGDKDLLDIQDKVKLYGVITPKELIELYTKIDVQISPSRSNHLFDGNFDGFPLGLEAMCFGSVLFTTDEFNNNQGFFDESNLVIIKPDVIDIYNHLEYLIRNPDEIRSIGMAGQKRIYELCDPDMRCKYIINILQQSMK